RVRSCRTGNLHPGADLGAVLLPHRDRISARSDAALHRRSLSLGPVHRRRPHVRPVEPDACEPGRGHDPGPHPCKPHHRLCHAGVFAPRRLPREGRDVRHRGMLEL
ncbi:hypothetical protein LTR94_027121, partial [Friedmanniomyces endolithicus]